MELLRYHYDDEMLTFLNETGSMLESICDKGLEGLNLILSSGQITEENNAFIFLFRNSLAIIDAIAEASKIPAVENIQLLARSYFEMKCFLEYMVKENYKNRTIAYQVFYIREKILQYKKIDGDTVEGKEFARKWSLDITFSPMKKVNYDTKSAILNLENQLNTEPYKSINEQFNSLKGKYDWYTLDTKRATFYGLCEYLGYPVSYDFFYKQWSELLHGKSAYRDNLANQDGKGGIEAIRSLANYKTVIGVLIPFIMECYMNIFKVLFPSYHIRMIRYYRNILKPKFDKFNTTNIEMIDQY